MWLLWTSLHRAMPMQIANGYCQCRLCRAISEVQVFAFTRFLSECCSFNHKSKALQASPSTLAALPVRGFLGPKTVQVAGSQVMWYLRFFSKGLKHLLDLLDLLDLLARHVALTAALHALVPGDVTRRKTVELLKAPFVPW